MCSDVYRAPKGAVEPGLPPYEFHKEIDEMYIRRIDEGIKDEIGWIIGPVPEYQREKIWNNPERGGLYFERSGQILASAEDFQLYYPHEKLHWLSRHVRRTSNRSTESSRVLLGSVVDLPVSGEDALEWLSEAVISETTQRVLGAVGEIGPTLIQYSETTKNSNNAYVEGIGSDVRRVGDYYRDEGYSQLYGDLFRPLVLRMASFLTSSDGQELYNSLRENNKLPNISSTSTHDQLCRVAVQIFQVGEFAEDNSMMFRMLNSMLGRGKLKELIQLSKDYDEQARLKLKGDKGFSQEDFDNQRTMLFDLINSNDANRVDRNG